MYRRMMLAQILGQQQPVVGQLEQRRRRTRPGPGLQGIDHVANVAMQSALDRRAQMEPGEPFFNKGPFAPGGLFGRGKPMNLLR